MSQNYFIPSTAPVFVSVGNFTLMTVSNFGPGTVYYGNNDQITVVTNSGSLAPNASENLDAGQYFIAAAPNTAHLFVSPVQDVSEGGGGGGPTTPTPTLLPYSRPGALATETGKARMRFPTDATLLSVSAVVDTAPTGQSVIIDVNKNGSTVFSTQANRPTIAAAENSSSEAVPDVVSITDGDYLTVDIDQVGSSNPGADLTVVIRYE